MANEKTLIYKEDLLNTILDYFGIDLAYLGKDLQFCQEAIEMAPAVDAVEVVHGRWEDMWDGKYANPRYRCSVCKEKANHKSVQDELLSWHDVQVLTPYCPYCLAKLDGGIGNDIKTV